MTDIVEWLRDRAFRKSGPTMEAVHTKQQEWVWADEIIRLREENKRLERENKKSRVAFLRIQCIAQDILRPVPFQEEDDEN